MFKLVMRKTRSVDEYDAMEFLEYNTYEMQRKLN